LAEVVRYDSDGKRNRYWLKHPREIRRRSRLAFPFREGRFSDGRAQPLAAVSFPGFWNSGNLHAEIYPSVRAPLKDTIKDRGQVRAMWHWGARPRRKELAHEGIRDPAGHRKRISGRPSHPQRRGLDPGLFGVDRSLYAQPARTERVHFHVSGIPKNVEVWPDRIKDRHIVSVQAARPGPPPSGQSQRAKRVLGAGTKAYRSVPVGDISGS
jgi:hypothetical protein